ncbi:MAG: CD1871A family CXXC motif-containing protein [Bacillota bacterium]
MDKKRVQMREVLLSVACILIVIGVFLGQHIDTMQKAIRICLECIGIG